jgi:N-acetylglucosamine-6-phosphate deacetylase
MTTQCFGVDALSGRGIAVTPSPILDCVEASARAHNGHFLAPGFIDLQVNGFAGVDYNTPAAPLEEIARSIRALFATGVTRFFPTVITGSPEDMAGAMRNLADARERLPEGAAIEGLHIEGPHISPEDGPRGAHPRRWVRRPDVHELHRWQDAARGLVRLVTLSPEWPEATRYIETAVREGVVISIGHTGATDAQIADAVSAGATLCTHLGNGAHAMLPRHPNYLWNQLADDRLTAGFIVDGIHLSTTFLNVALRAKGVARSFLVTDAVMPAGAAPGLYRLGEQEVELLADNRVVLPGTSRLAGSSLRMHHGVANLMRLAGLGISDAVAMATVQPARAMQIAGRTTGLAAGERGDIIEFESNSDDQSLEIEKTYLDGKLVYERAKA